MIYKDEHLRYCTNDCTCQLYINVMYGSPVLLNICHKILHTFSYILTLE